MDIKALWYSNITIAWWKMLLMGLFFLGMNICIFLAMWYVRRGVACEYGYPKRNKKSMKKLLASHSKLDSLLLLKLTREAPRKGTMLYINLLCHNLCMIALGSASFGFVGCMVTLADGWALLLFIFA